MLYVGGATISAMFAIFFAFRYTQIFFEIFESILLEAKRTRNKTIRQQKLLLAYRQHMYMIG